MSVGKKNKDNLKAHGGVALVAPILLPKSEDPLRFWTNHPSENILVDLHSFAKGEFENPHPNGPTSGQWGGPYTGRPQLIAELAPALEARVALKGKDTPGNYLNALRRWWRFFDAIEQSSLTGGGQIARVNSLVDLNELHEAAARQHGIHSAAFRIFVTLVNDARRLRRLHALPWMVPRKVAGKRILIPQDQAKEIKTALKQDWERTRLTWAKKDVIRGEADRRRSGENPFDQGEDGEYLLKHWQYFQQIQLKTGCLLPNTKQILDGGSRDKLYYRGLDIRVMRAVLFPTSHEVDIAFFLALINSGWNPATLANLDASNPNLIAAHPKNDKQMVLAVMEEEEGEEITMQADKSRAHGKTQFCIGLKKNPSSPPMIVAAHLNRVESLRELLKVDCQAACEELERLRIAGADTHEIERQYLTVQTIRQGCRSVWLYVDQAGKIKWLTWKSLQRHRLSGSKKTGCYLDLVIERLNLARIQRNEARTKRNSIRTLAGGQEQLELPEPMIANVTPSDLRDIYARWVYVQSGGNILAVMLALGHSSMRSTVHYVENNIFDAESDEHARRFLGHLFDELQQGRLDLTILAQLVRHGPLTPDMEVRLTEYRGLMRSRLSVGCADPHHPPTHVAPNHQEGRLCGTQRCLLDCPHAKFLPESLDGIAMRIEELQAMSDILSRETWLRGGFEGEMDAGELLLANLFEPEAVAEARQKWRDRIACGSHLLPGVGRITPIE